MKARKDQSILQENIMEKKSSSLSKSCFVSKLNCPYIFFCLIMLIYHILLYFVGDYGDDMGVFSSLQNKSLFDYILFDRYLGHSSRVAGDLLTALLVQLPFYVFLIINYLIWISLHKIVSLLLGLTTSFSQWIWNFLC